MINAKDLRVDVSIVTVDNPQFHPKLKDVPLLVTGISKTRDCEGNMTFGINLEHINQQPNTYYESYSQFIKYLKPIPLTNEMLEKCGFIFKLKYCIWRNEKLEIVQWEYPIYKLSDELEVKLEYLHQLQNLYLDLIREDLNVKL